MFESAFVCFVKYSFPVAKFMVFITFERRDKTCSNIEKNSFLLVHWVAKNSKTNEKTRSSRPEVFFKKRVFKNFAKFTGKHLRWSIFLTELHV